VEDGLLKFSGKSREELIETILRQEKEIEALKKKLKEQEEKEARKKELRFLRLLAKTNRPKSPGQKAGHRGFTRIKPKTIDRVVEQTLKYCPDCHHRLSESQEVIEHVQEDIIPAHPQVTLFKKHRYWCQDCKKLVTAPYASDEIPHGNLGPNVLIQSVILKYHHGLPFAKIEELFKSLCQFEVTDGALAQALQRISQWLQVEVSEILKAIRASPHLHMDETGWKISGTNHWLWACVNERLAYYQIAQSRGAKIPKAILPKDYSGILVTDFYSAYNRLPGKKQKCLVHLMREMHQLYLKDQSEAFLEHHKTLKRILSDALRLKDSQGQMAVPVYQRRIKRLKTRLFLWSCREYRNKHLKRLAQRFLNHWLHLLTFLEHPEISFNNNLAERMIRHHVILRNRSFQNRSHQGAAAHQTLMSLLHTLQLQDKNPLNFLKKAYLKHRQGNPLPILRIASVG
jgi:transposase